MSGIAGNVLVFGLLLHRGIELKSLRPLEMAIHLAVAFSDAVSVVVINVVAVVVVVMSLSCLQSMAHLFLGKF